jgi:hypothetical protein
VTYGGFWQVFADESPQIAKKFSQIEKVLSVESENLSVDLERNGHFVMKFGYLCNKIIVFWETLRR